MTLIPGGIDSIEFRRDGRVVLVLEVLRERSLVDLATRQAQALGHAFGRFEKIIWN